MKAVIQRVSKAEVQVEAKVVGSIGPGLMVLLCVEQGDTEAECAFVAKKSVELRIFSDENGKMNRSLLDVNGEMLLISQFTLAAEWKKGRRPGFTGAASPDEGERLYQHFGSLVEGYGVNVARGIFGAHMEVTLTNDGPVTLMLEHREVPFKV